MKIKRLLSAIVVTAASSALLLQQGWIQASASGIDDIAIAVHEETYGLVHQKHFESVEEINAGNEISIHVGTFSLAATGTNSITQSSSNTSSGTSTITTTYSYSSTISSIGNGERKETSWFTVSSSVLVLLWAASLMGILVIVFEIIRGRKRK